MKPHLDQDGAVNEPMDSATRFSELRCRVSYSLALLVLAENHSRPDVGVIGDSEAGAAGRADADFWLGVGVGD